MHEQLQVGAKIPDFVLVHAPDDQPTVHRSLTSLESVVLAELLSACASSALAIAERLFAQPARIETALENLRRAGLVSGEPGDAYGPTEKALPTATVLAIEAKLTRWREAVDQAESYLSFANLSYVALPLATIEWRREVIIAECSARGIGLLGVDHGALRIEHAAPFYAGKSADWLWVVCRSLAPHRATSRKRTAQRPRATRVDASSSSAG